MMITANGRARDWRRFFFDNLVITLNGEAIRDIVEADDEAGYVIILVRDEAGKMIVAPSNRGTYLTERIEGTVVFHGTRRFSPEDAKAAAATKRDRRRLRNMAVVRRAANRGASQ